MRRRPGDGNCLVSLCDCDWESTIIQNRKHMGSLSDMMLKLAMMLYTDRARAIYSFYHSSSTQQNKRRDHCRYSKAGTCFDGKLCPNFNALTDLA